MPTKRPEYRRGHYYHFYNRGAHRTPIFREDDNYLYVLRKMKEYCTMLRLTPIAYCLMPNHYHYLVRQDGDHSASLLAQRVFGGYANAWSGETGHGCVPLERKCRVVAVTRDSDLLHLCRYILANPVTHGLVADVADWPYSNYREWTGQRDGTFVDRDFVRARFAAGESYRRFVADYLAGGRRTRAPQMYLQAWES